jgi:hypothetical protein
MCLQVTVFHVKQFDVTLYLAICVNAQLKKKKKYTIEDVDTIRINDDIKPTIIIQSFYLLSYLQNNDFSLTSQHPSLGLNRYSHVT